MSQEDVIRIIHSNSGIFHLRDIVLNQTYKSTLFYYNDSEQMWEYLSTKILALETIDYWIKVLLNAEKN